MIRGLRGSNTASRERALFLTWEFGCGIAFALRSELSADRVTEELLDSNVFSKAGYFADDRRGARWIEEQTPIQWSGGASLTVVLLVSLGLWAAAWEVIASLASTLLR